MHIQLGVFKDNFSKVRKLFELQATIICKVLELKDQLSNERLAAIILCLVVKVVVAAIYLDQRFKATVLESYRERTLMVRGLNGVVA